VRLGFSVAILGVADLPSFDQRAVRQDASLGVSLVCLRDILCYLQASNIHMYRMHSGLMAPALAEGTPDPRRRLDAYANELEALGELARTADVRLSFHPYSVVNLSTPDEEQAARAARYLQAQAHFLDLMRLGEDAVIVVHVGGVYDDMTRARERFAQRYARLDLTAQRRLVLENDDHRFAFVDVQAVHHCCGIPLVFDHLHHLVYNPQRIPLPQAMQQALDTWPAERTPKIHFSSPRTELRRLEQGRVKVPTWTEHSDLVNPFAFAELLLSSAHLRLYDVMLEAKARDLALIQLRRDLARFFPELAGKIL
jgi:UV DNA damage endonuclease